MLPLANLERIDCAVIQYAGLLIVYIFRSFTLLFLWIIRTNLFFCIN
jgi:hypothetical protein